MEASSSSMGEIHMATASTIFPAMGTRNLRRASSTLIEPVEDCSLADLFYYNLGDPPKLEPPSLATPRFWPTWSKIIQCYWCCEVSILDSFLTQQQVTKRISRSVWHKASFPHCYVKGLKTENATMSSSCFVMPCYSSQACVAAPTYRGDSSGKHNLRKSRGRQESGTAVSHRSCSAAKSRPILCDPMGCGPWASPSSTIFWSFAQILA